MIEIIKIKSENGFSLIELVVIITVIAIISAIGIPAFNDFVASGRIRDAATELLQEMKLTRIMAIKTSTPYVIAFGVGANTYTIGADPAGTGVPGAYGTTGAPKIINLQNKYGASVGFGSGAANAPSAAPLSCPACIAVGAAPVAFGTVNPLTQTFNIDGTVNNPPGHAAITHATQNITYMVNLSFETGRLQLWVWDGKTGNLTPPVVADCAAAQQRACGWTRIK